MAQATSDHSQTPGADIYASFHRVFRGLKRLRGGNAVDGPTLGILYEINTRGPVRLSDLASCVGLDASTVSRHVTGLERDGHVTREADPADGRASRLVLSDHGRAVMTEAIERRHALVGAALEHWTQRDRDALHRLLDRLAEDIERVTSLPSGLPTGSRQEQPA